ncbi:18.1 kDa class I heat shock protein-like [Silene latifolia]|uniref:18.1 kDa class I heat shock protein-like n=1 Tax=Silene latifolia TaxID=37657 RepID=UPI003D782FEA
MSAVNNLVDNLKNMSLDKWDPMYWATQACPVLNSPVDWKETEKAHIFMVDLPGVNKEEVKVEVDQERVLEISGDRGGVTNHEESANDGGVWHRVERARGKFLRRFRLPENAKVDEVKAEMENGVLKVVVPKQEVKKVERKVVEIEEK